MQVFVGTVIHSTWQTPMVVMEKTAIGIEKSKIVFICSDEEIDNVKRKYGVSDGQIVYLNKGEFLIPGFVDTHIHASQYVNAGKAIDLSLMEWLNSYTFPEEAKFSDLDYAEEIYNKAVRRVLMNGTTTACYFATNHRASTLKLCEIIGRYGQRGFVGKVCSNQNSPSYYIETTEESVLDTDSFIRDVQSMKNDLLNPVVTPRFAISCDFKLLQALGELKEKYNLRVQSHISENKRECELVKGLYPNCAHYLDVYRKSNLLGPKTIMAHAIYLCDEELDMLKTTETGVSHCPNSNISICSGMCDLRRLLERKIKVGLGTDISGGFHPSMLNAIRLATQTSNMLSLDRPTGYKRVDFKEAFRIATLGGAQVLAIDSRVGNFEVGKEFDAIIVNVCCPESPFDIFPEDTIEDMMQKFIYLGDDRNIKQVFVAGQSVWPKK